MTETYMPTKVTVAWNGIPISGYAPDTFIEAERNNDAFNLVVGSGGEGARAGSGDKSGIVTLTLLQTSATNAALTAAALLDENSGDGIGPLAVVDLSGQDVVKAEKAWIRKRPNAAYANTIQNREWVFETANLEILVAGNVRPE